MPAHLGTMADQHIRPTYRWPSLTTPNPNVYLGQLAVPLPPGQALQELSSREQLAGAVPAAVLQDVISLLQGSTLAPL